MALPANIPGLPERAEPSAYDNMSLNISVCGQRALNDRVNRADRALTFRHSEALDWHFHLFSDSNEEPLPFSVAARLSIGEPEGETSDHSVAQHFHVTGAVTLPQTICHLLRYGLRMPVLGWEVRLLATDSVIIVSPLASTSDNPETLPEPEPILLHTTAYRSLQDKKVTIPISWEGLQFQLPTHKSENDRNDPARNFYVLLQVVAIVFAPNPITVSQVRAGPFQSRPLDGPHKDTVPASADARLTLPTETQTTSSGSSHDRSLSDVSSSQSKLPSRAKKTALPENKGTKSAVSPLSHLRARCRFRPYSSSTTSTRQRKAIPGYFGRPSPEIARLPVGVWRRHKVGLFYTF